MTNEFMREEHYIVFKISDLGDSLEGDEIRRLAREYAEQRRLKGKKPLECVVVEKENEMKPLVIYHANCTDGFGAAIAKTFGGGGHRNAAGFSTDIDTLVGWLK